MKRNLDTVIRLLNGEPMLNGHSAETATPYTVGAAISDALVAQFQQEQPQPDEAEKRKRFKLALTCMLKGEQDFTTYDLMIITKVANLAFATLIFGQIDAWAEGEVGIAAAEAQAAPEVVEASTEVA